MAKGAKSQPTLVDIAKVAKVSKSTVSRALKNYHTIPRHTCERIQQIARDLGYSPHPYVGVLMSHLRTGESESFRSTIAYLDFASTPDKWKTNLISRKFHEGAEKRGEERGFRVKRFWTRQHGLSRLARIFKAQGITGIIIPESGVGLDEIKQHFEQFSCVVIGRQPSEPAYFSAYGDVYGAARTAHQMLLKKGFKRIGFVSYPRVDRGASYRFSSGFESLRYDAQWRNHKNWIPILNAELGESALLKPWFEQHEPDVVLAIFPFVGTWLTDLGLKIPEDVSFAHFECHREQTESAGIDQRSEHVGAAAVDMVVEQFNRGEKGAIALARSVVVKGSWVDGKTVRIPGREVNS